MWVREREKMRVCVLRSWGWSEEEERIFPLHCSAAGLYVQTDWG
jgi:hypothetical protein